MPGKDTREHDILDAGSGASASDDEQPPILGAWPNVYAAVLALHVLLIIAVYFITSTYA